MQKQRHIVIVGGGAAGIVAAISAARAHALVTIIEQKDRIGKKILSTGNGRCNLTNEYMDISCFRGDDLEILSPVFTQFGYQETLQFFEELGVLFKNRQGYIYPLSDQASTILDVLRQELLHLQVHILTDTKVLGITPTKRGFSIQTNHKTIKSDAVILTTGGKASPVLGSDGSGYSLAKSLGHSLSPVTPALVQLQCKGSFFKQVAGVRTNATVRLFVDGKPKASDTGELQLTNYGISGIPVFQISRFASKAFYQKQSVSVQIDFLPTYTKEELQTLVKTRLERQGYKKTEDFLVGMFHKKLIVMLLKEAHISLDQSASSVSWEQWMKLIHCCKEFKVSVIATNPFEQAQVCAGGVKTSELDPHTLESRYVKDLFLAGELLDIDGICGGYNLQWAWSTGYLAGLYAAKGVSNVTN